MSTDESQPEFEKPLAGACVHEWVAEAGTFEIVIGASAQDIRATVSFELAETARWRV